MSSDDRFATLERRVAELEDRERITALTIRYARGLDRNDPELVASVFWPDAEIDFGTTTFAVDEFVEWDLAAQTTRLTSYAHHVSNSTIDLDGDVAHTETYVIGLFVPREDAPEPQWGQEIAAGRYVDRVERRGGEWRIAVREFKAILVGRLTTIPIGADTPPHATWDRADLSYLRPLPRRFAAP